MNAGDRFAAATRSRPDVPSPYHTTELLWGDCIIESRKGDEYDSARDVLRYLHRQMTVCHQSLFVKRAALLARPFDESLRIAADYDFLCERLLAGASWEYRPVAVSRIDDRGVSTLGFPHKHQGEAKNLGDSIPPEEARHHGILRLAMLLHDGKRNSRVSHDRTFFIGRSHGQ